MAEDVAQRLNEGEWQYEVELLGAIGVGDACPSRTSEQSEYTMNFQSSLNSGPTARQLPFECVALVLQGSGALGAYQAGVYEALAEARIDPDWIAGISIGAINSAIIAGNPVNMRVERLREFWTL